MLQVVTSISSNKMSACGKSSAKDHTNNLDKIITHLPSAFAFLVGGACLETLPGDFDANSVIIWFKTTDSKPFLWS